MLASSGEMTAPCGVPSSLATSLPFFQRAGLQPFAYQANDAWVADPVLQELDQPLVADRVEEALDVGVHDPAHIGARDAHRQRVQRLCWLRRGLNPYEKPRKSCS